MHWQVGKSPRPPESCRYIYGSGRLRSQASKAARRRAAATRVDQHNKLLRWEPEVAHSDSESIQRTGRLTLQELSLAACMKSDTQLPLPPGRGGGFST